MSDRRYFTPKTIAQLWGCCAETIIGHIRAGRLRAFSLSPPGSRKPRWRIPHDAIVEYEQRQAAIPPEKPARRKRPEDRGVIQFFQRGKVATK